MNHVIYWLPVWAHLFVCGCAIGTNNGMIAWFAATTAWFAWCWLAGVPTHGPEDEKEEVAK